MLHPSEDDFNGLLKYFKEIGGTLQHGDQELIELYFKNVRKRPVQLLSPLEATFGHCLGSVSPSRSVRDQVLSGWWSIPAFVHKSGGWGNVAAHRYTNVCFSHDVGRQ